MRASSSTPSTPSSMRRDDALERLHGRHRLAQLHVARCRRRTALARSTCACESTLLEEADGLFVLAVAVLVAAEHVVELPVEVALLRVVEARDLLVGVLADALDDVGRLGQLRGELGQPEQRLVELQVVRLVGDLGEDGVARLVELQAVERDREVVLRDLLVAVVVARFALEDAIECRAPLRSSARCRRGAWPGRPPPSSDRLEPGPPPPASSSSMSRGCSPFFGGALPAGAGAAAGGAAGAGAAGAAAGGGAAAPPFFFFFWASAPPVTRRRAALTRQTRATQLRIIFLAFNGHSTWCGETN